jgi:hypothetical protein
MTRITFTYSDDLDERTIVREIPMNKIFDLFAAADFFTEALQVAGFAYVDAVSIHASDRPEIPGKTWTNQL